MFFGDVGVLVLGGWVEGLEEGGKKRDGRKKGGEKHHKRS